MNQINIVVSAFFTVFNFLQTECLRNDQPDQRARFRPDVRDLNQRSQSTRDVIRLEISGLFCPVSGEQSRMGANLGNALMAVVGMSFPGAIRIECECEPERQYSK